MGVETAHCQLQAQKTLCLRAIWIAVGRAQHTRPLRAMVLQGSAVLRQNGAGLLVDVLPKRSSSVDMQVPARLVEVHRSGAFCLVPSTPTSPLASLLRSSLPMSSDVLQLGRAPCSV